MPNAKKAATIGVVAGTAATTAPDVPWDALLALTLAFAGDYLHVLASALVGGGGAVIVDRVIDRPTANQPTIEKDQS